MATKKVKSYSEEFRKNAVALADQPDKTAREVAESLGIHVNQIYNWRTQFKKLSKGQFKIIDGVDYSKSESEEIRRLKKENTKLQKERDFLKKSSGVLCRSRRVKYAFIDTCRRSFPLILMCRVLSVSRTGYYKWKHHEVSQRQQQRELIKSHVIRLYHEFKCRYGAIRLTKELNETGFSCSLNHVAKLLREAELKAKNGKGFKYSKSNSGLFNIKPNVLGRCFTASRPNEKWVTDITYVYVKNKWMYLSVVMDLFSRAIVGWAFDTQMTDELICSALEMALMRREISEGLLVHSDQGVQYRSHWYQSKLLAHGCEISMSRRGNCWDNAAVESFFSRLKVELIFGEKFTTLEHAKREIFEYIEIFYNRQRRHSANGYISPMQFEQLNS